MKQTLLEIVQEVLSATEGEEVNSISDTSEAELVAQDVKAVYRDIITRKDWQFLRRIKRLDSLADSTKPNYLLLPENASELDYFKYNHKKAGNPRNFFREVHFKYPDDFLHYVNQRDNSAANYTTVTDYEGFLLTIRTDHHPTYYTSFDDVHIVCDSYNSAIQSTLQGDDTQAQIYMLPGWSMTDGFIPDLPAEMFPLLAAECKSYALAKEQDELIQKTEQTAGRQQRHKSQQHGRVQTGVRLPNYGRKSAKAPSTRRNPLFGPKS